MKKYIFFRKNPVENFWLKKGEVIENISQRAAEKEGLIDQKITKIQAEKRLEKASLT